MRVTVIPSDKWIRRDDLQINLPTWPFADEDIHAIQWYGTRGEIEYVGDPKPANKITEDQSVIEKYLEAVDEYLIASTAPQ